MVFCICSCLLLNASTYLFYQFYHKDVYNLNLSNFNSQYSLENLSLTAFASSFIYSICLNEGSYLSFEYLASRYCLAYCLIFTNDPNCFVFLQIRPSQLCIVLCVFRPTRRDIQGYFSLVCLCFILSLQFYDYFFKILNCIPFQQFGCSFHVGFPLYILYSLFFFFQFSLIFLRNHFSVLTTLCLSCTLAIDIWLYSAQLFLRSPKSIVKLFIFRANNKDFATINRTIKNAVARMKEIISIAVGQCGINILQQTFNKHIQEHALTDPDLHQKKEIRLPHSYFNFTDQSPVSYIPRAILVDSQPGAIDRYRGSLTLGTHTPLESYIHSNMGTGNNFAKGKFHFGSQLADVFSDSLHRMTEACDSLQGIQLFHSVGGGSGSGLAAKLVDIVGESVGQNYVNITFTVTPSTLKQVYASDNVLEMYNTVLALRDIHPNVQAMVLMSNQSLLCKIPNPRRFFKQQISRIIPKTNRLLFNQFSDTNKVYGQSIVNMSGSQRLGNGSLNTRKMLMNLIPFARTNLLGFSQTYWFGDLRSKREHWHSRKDIVASMKHCLSLRGEMSAIDQITPFVGSQMFLRGSACLENFQRIQIEHYVKHQRNRRRYNQSKIQFLDWLKDQILFVDPSPAGQDNLHNSWISSLNNNTAIAQPLAKYVNAAQAAFLRKSYLHHFVQEGLQEEDITSALSDLNDIKYQYQSYNSRTDCGQEQGTDWEEQQEQQQQEQQQ